MTLSSVAKENKRILEGAGSESILDSGSFETDSSEVNSFKSSLSDSKIFKSASDKSFGGSATAFLTLLIKLSKSSAPSNLSKKFCFLESASLLSESFREGPNLENLESNSSGFSTFWLFFRMILVLGIVVVCIYAVVWFMKKSVKGESDEDEPFLRKVSSVSLAPGKSVQIVTLVDKGFIVGVSEDSVNLISEINDKELIDAMNLYSDKKKQTQKPRSFADVLEIFMPRKKDTNIYDDSSKKFTDMLNKQRDRLQDGE